MTVRVRAVWDLYERGLPPRRIAKALRLPATTVYARLRCARAELGVTPAEAPDEVGARLPRCRCLLLLPCRRCLPTVTEVAARRVA
jgi:hypothetical protein